MQFNIEFVFSMTVSVTILVLLENSLQSSYCSSVEVPKHLSQSLFYWKTPCNQGEFALCKSEEGVTILVLLENSLQLNALIMLKNKLKCHNPCFIGKLLAMSVLRDQNKPNELSQSLFYWKTPCNYRCGRVCL